MRPRPAKRETSGISRALSSGTPGPVCQDGLRYKPLRPPEPPTVRTNSRKRSLLQLASALGLLPSNPRIRLVHDTFQVVSGIYPFADRCVVASLEALQYSLARF